MEPKRRGKFKVSYEFLRTIMGLPDNTEIVYVHTSPDDLTRCAFELYIDHPDLPLCLEGGIPSDICPEFQDNPKRQAPKLIRWDIGYPRLEEQDDFYLNQEAKDGDRNP